MKKIIYLSLLLPLSFLFNSNLQSQQADIMMQGWYWDYPKPGCNGYNGVSIAAEMAAKAAAQKNAGFTMMWMPPMAKASFGNCSMGYDPKDLYDYGQYTGRTGLGTGAEVEAWVASLTANNIYPIADVVYNHRDGGDWEDNPAVRNYVLNYPYGGGCGGFPATPFPVNGKMRYRLPVGGSSGNGAGDYYFKFASASGDAGFHGREYKLYFRTQNTIHNPIPFYESSSNGGVDCSTPNDFDQIWLGLDIFATQETTTGCNTDEFYLQLEVDDFLVGGDFLEIYIEEIGGGGTGIDQRIYGIWSASRGMDIMNDLQVQTRTDFSGLPSGQGAMHWQNFKPNGITPTCLTEDEDYPYFFFDVEQAYNGSAGGESTRKIYDDWNKWMWNSMGIRGYRMDAVKHFPAWFVGQLLNDLHAAGKNPPMVVGEHFTADANALKGWIDAVYAEMTPSADAAINVRAFDFELRGALREACDEFGYDVRNIFSKGIVDRANMSGANAVTFVNNHDYRDPSGGSSLIKNDPILAYAYILTNNQIGLPTVFYPDYYGYPQPGEPGYDNYFPVGKSPLMDQIDELMDIHNKYIFGASARKYLNASFASYQNSASLETNKHILVYQLQGNSGFKDIVVAINFGGGQVNFSQQIDGVAMGTSLEDLTGNALHSAPIVENANGISNSIWISIPGRSYAIYRIGSWGLFAEGRSNISFNRNGSTLNYTVWNNASGTIQNADLGTFVNSDLLQLTSYDIRTWKKSGADVTSGKLFYTIYPKGQRPTSPDFQNQDISFIQNIDAAGDQKWGFTDAAINLLSGLQSGEYTLEFYSQMNGTDPNKSVYDNNGGNATNYTAHFRYNYVRSNADGNWSAATTWLDQVIPDNAAVSAEINHHVILSESKSVNDLKILGGSLTISSTFTFTVVGTASSTLNETGLILQSGLSGTASLIHNSPGVKATIQRHIPAANWSVAGEGWHLISPPVSGQAISGGWSPSGSGNDYDFYGWDEPSATWLNQKVGANNITHFTPGKGYLTAYQQTAVKEFAGPINVANHSVTLTKTGSGSYSGWNLLGNSFASAIDWKHASWNLDEAIGGVAKIWSNGGYIDIDTDEPIIPSANGFFAYSDQDDIELTIPAAARLHDEQNWYKSSGNRILLTAKAVGSEMVQRSVVKVNPQATEGFDLQFDSRFLTGYAPAFYSLANGEKLSTNTLPAISEQTAIPFNFVKNDAEEFQISLLESIAGLEVYLTDLKMNIQHKLYENPVYSFASASGDEPGRFLLHFGAVGMNDLNTSRQAFAWNTGDQLFVNNPAESATLSILDVQGRLLKTWNLVGEGLKQISLNLPKGVYIVYLSSQQSSYSTKVVFY